MNRINRLVLSCTFPVAALVAADAARAEQRCANPETRIDQRACELAQRGPEELRRFVQRTQSIYHLNFFDYVSEEQARRWAEREAPVARRERRAPIGASVQG